MPTLPPDFAQLIIADPPYFRVLLDERWDTAWPTEQDYLAWSISWLNACRRVLRSNGLLYVFGQLGKREHVWLHFCSQAAEIMQFHDMIIWDRKVGYHERSDSFTPQYEMILVLRQPDCEKPYFDKDAVRIPYDEKTIQTYLKDSRYKDRHARENHLRKGKYATNILRFPSLKGNSKEKVGHPSQKPLSLVTELIRSSSKPGDMVLDPFLGSGTTAIAAERQGRKWTGIEQNPNYAKIANNRLRNDACLSSKCCPN